MESKGRYYRSPKLPHFPVFLLKEHAKRFFSASGKIQLFYPFSLLLLNKGGKPIITVMYMELREMEYRPR